MLTASGTSAAKSALDGRTGDFAGFDHPMSSVAGWTGSSDPGAWRGRTLHGR